MVRINNLFLGLLAATIASGALAERAICGCMFPQHHCAESRDALFCENLPEPCAKKGGVMLPKCPSMPVGTCVCGSVEFLVGKYYSPEWTIDRARAHCEYIEGEWVEEPSESFFP